MNSTTNSTIMKENLIALKERCLNKGFKLDDNFVFTGICYHLNRMVEQGELYLSEKDHIKKYLFGLAVNDFDLGSGSYGHYWFSKSPLGNQFRMDLIDLAIERTIQKTN